jgi:hypothetical protein
VGKLYFNKLIPAAVSAPSENASFPVSNLALDSIEKEYQSATPVQNYMLYDFTSPVKVAGVLLQATNIAEPSLFLADVDGSNFLNMPATKSASDPHLRRRSIFSVANMFPRYVTIYFSAALIGAGTSELSLTAVSQGVLAAKSWYPRIWTGSQLIASGDSIRYEVFVDPSSPAVNASTGAGSVEIGITTTPFNGRTQGLVDGNDVILIGEPTGARTGFVSRTISLTPFAGKTMNEFMLVCEGDNNGKWLAKYRNIRIADSGGADKLILYRGGAVTPLADYASAGYYYKILSGQGGPTDGQNFYRCGAMHVFADVATIKNPEHGVQLKYEHGEIYNELPNKKISRAQIGTRGERWSGRFLLTDIAMLPQILQAMRTGVFAIDWEHADYPWAMAPLRCMDPADVITFARPGGTEVQFSAMEVV